MEKYPQIPNSLWSLFLFVQLIRIKSLAGACEAYLKLSHYKFTFPESILEGKQYKQRISISPYQIKPPPHKLPVIFFYFHLIINYFYSLHYAPWLTYIYCNLKRHNFMRWIRCITLNYQR